jgi:hypothetical protein
MTISDVNEDESEESDVIGALSIAVDMDEAEVNVEDNIEAKPELASVTTE